jgi:hypothetical protein
VTATVRDYTLTGQDSRLAIERGLVPSGLDGSAHR